MNAFSDGHIHSKSGLQKFWSLVWESLSDKVEKEYEVDFWSPNTDISCGSKSLAQVQIEYTHTKFIEGQCKFQENMNSFVVGMFSCGYHCYYDVMEENIHGGQPKETIFHVSYKCDVQEFSCTYF